ncbi:MAG: class II aldolase/adducin family protein [Bdellovibrionaceae bacterium]|nr:class II aldolase/adducin family protein [Pseudobdellovibrionaceae bacterium]
MQHIKNQIVRFCELLHQKNMLAAADGNVSYRHTDEEIFITPSGVPKAFIDVKDIAVITIDNKIVSGRPSGERLMHLEVYKKSPIAKAVVHAHPPSAIAWTVAFPEYTELPSECLSEVILAAGKIPIVPYARPGTLEMGTHLHAFLPKYRAMILSRHGALCWGESLQEAYCGMERIEHSADTLIRAKMLGQLTNLPEAEVQKLRELRVQLGDKLL